MAVRESQSVSSMLVGMGKRAARNFLRKILRIRGHETLRQNAYKAPSRYFRGLMRLLSRERRQARQPIINTPWPVERPMVSVIIPCYNYGHYVKEALQSVLNSTWSDLEVIVVEGGSTDGTTPDVVRSLEGGKVRCIYQSRRCYECENRFFGLQHVRGKYILFLDADDQIDHHYIENAVYLMETTGVDVIVPDLRVTTTPEEMAAAAARRQGGQVWSAVGLEVPRIFEENTAPGTSMFRYSFWKDNNIGMCIVNSYAPDWDFWMRLTSHGARFIHVAEPYHNYRQHNTNVTLTFNVSTRLAHMEMVRNRFERVRNDPIRLEEIRYLQDQRPKVYNPFVNLLTRPVKLPRGEVNVLVAVPWFDNYGVSVLLENIFGRITKSGVTASVVGTDPETKPEFLEGMGRFLSFTRDCYYLATCLPEGNKPDFLAYLVRSRKIDVLMINGSRMTYEMLSRLRRENPKLHVVDHLFNTTGHIASNREFTDQIDLSIVASGEVREELIRRGEDATRIETIHHGIDVEDFKPGLSPRIPRANGEPLTFGYLGRLSEEKRPEDVVEMARRFPEYRFVIAGAGSLRPQIEKAIQHAGVGARVQLAGTVPSAKEFYNSVDAVLIPSRIEGLPLVLLEAMASEKPVIAAHVGMMGEVIENGVNGFTFPSGDREAMAQAIRQLGQCPSDAWSTLRRKARATVIQNYSLERCASEYLAVFHRLVKQRIG